MSKRADGFRRKSVRVRAFQMDPLTREDPSEWPHWALFAVLDGRIVIAGVGPYGMDPGIEVGGISLHWRDWICLESGGTLDTMDDETFKDTYEPSDDLDHDAVLKK